MSFKAILILSAALSCNALAAGTAAVTKTTTTTTTSAAVPFTDAPKYYNQKKTVEGSVVSTFCDDKRCFLNFDKDFRKYLSAVIEGASVIQFSTASTPKDRQADLMKTFGGKKIQITGMLTEYKNPKDAAAPGRPQIMVTDKADVKIIQ